MDYSISLCLFVSSVLYFFFLFFQILLNETHPLEGTPSVRAVSAGHTENSVGSDAKVSTSDQRRLFHHPRHDKNKKFAPTTSNNHSDSANPNSDADSPAAKNDYNIVPEALTERDVQRLAWAVQRVRSIVRDMRLQDLSALTEVSPGGLAGHRLSSTNGFSSGNYNSSSDSAAGRAEEAYDAQELAEWVSYIFFSSWLIQNHFSFHHTFFNHDCRSARTHFCSRIGSALLQWGRVYLSPLLLCPAATRILSRNTFALYVRTLPTVTMKWMIYLTMMAKVTKIKMKIEKRMELMTRLPALLWWTSTSVSGTF